MFSEKNYVNIFLLSPMRAKCPALVIFNNMITQTWVYLGKIVFWDVTPYTLVKWYLYMLVKLVITCHEFYVSRRQKLICRIMEVSVLRLGYDLFPRHYHNIKDSI
jgi:hypothetical protein